MVDSQPDIFFQLVQPYRVESRRGNRGDVGHVANVIQLGEGSCIVQWLHDPKSMAIYSSIVSLRLALCKDGAMLLTMVRTAERAGAHHATIPHLTARDALTDSDRHVVALLGHGLSNREIGEQLNFSEQTVKNKLSAIYVKMGVRDRTQAALLARDLDLKEVPA